MSLKYRTETPSLYRRMLDDALWLGRPEERIHAWGKANMDAYQAAFEEARRAHRRPPSVVAYVMRCLGKVLEGQKHLLAASYGNKWLIPEKVDIALVMEAKMPDNIWLPWYWVFERVEEKGAKVIEDELISAAKKLRRNPVKMPPGTQIFLTLPQSFRRILYNLCKPFFRRYFAEMQTKVGITSLTHVSKRDGYGQSPSLFTLQVVIGVLHKQEEKWQINISFSANHRMMDGIAFTKLMESLGDELESGRCLKEFLPENQNE
ncbi:MAG TPA: hypothetical protein PLO56_11955 [Rhodothermales bacterium]|mgnify:FL=1|nr:hypothetical protein [Rhodothermales bacterium]